MNRGKGPLVPGAPGEEVLRFGTCRLDYARGLLYVDGTEVWLPPKALAVLEYLLQRPAAVVSRIELLSMIWKDRVVTDHSLTEIVRVLRRALGDDPRNPAYIQTVHRRGYRLVADVQLDDVQLDDTQQIAMVWVTNDQSPVALDDKATSSSAPLSISGLASTGRMKRHCARDCACGEPTP